MGNAHIIRGVEAFVEFLSSGRLGRLNPSLSESELRDLLGKPDDYFVRDRQSAKPIPSASPQMTIMYYGNLGVTYEDGRIIIIVIDFRTKRVVLPERLGIQWADTVKFMSPNAFSEFLSERHIHYTRVDIPERFSAEVIFELNSRTEIAFTEEDVLELIAFFPRGLSWTLHIQAA